MNVLSLFDGMSCGQQALQRAGINVDNYFASEIDKFAITVTMANYPNTKQLGSVTQVDGYSLPQIDILIGGSPCQSFSFAGKCKGMSTKDEQEILTLEHYLQLKSEGYEFEGQSYLFWEYMRLINEVKPKYFLLENVMMGEKWERVLSKAIGVNPIEINSALVSAQNRRRLYWTNIGHEPGGLFGDLVCKIKQPKDRGILLKDILENDVDEKYFLSDKAIKSIQNWNAQQNPLENIETNYRKNGCLTARGNEDMHSVLKLVIHNTMPRSGDPKKGGTGHLSRNDGKTYCLDTGNTNAVEIVAMRERGDENIQQLEPRHDGKTNCLTSVQKDNLVRQLNPSLESGGKQPYQQNRIYDVDGITPALCAFKSDLLINTSRIRRLTPIECKRLQTVADNYTAHVSDSQRYKMLGNGWTVDVIAHILKHII